MPHLYMQRYLVICDGLEDNHTENFPLCWCRCHLGREGDCADTHRCLWGERKAHHCRIQHCHHSSPDNASALHFLWAYFLTQSLPRYRPCCPPRCPIHLLTQGTALLHAPYSHSPCMPLPTALHLHTLGQAITTGEETFSCPVWISPHSLLPLTAPSAQIDWNLCCS